MNEAHPYLAMTEVFEQMQYPAGERHIRLRTNAPCRAVVEASARSFDDLAEIITADRIVRLNGGSYRWVVPYFPFARHDRRSDRCDGFELQLALQLVADIDLVVVDPHSDVAGQLPHIDQRDVVAAMADAGLFDGDPVVVVPDAGAAKKVQSWVGRRPTIQALKTRDSKTGRILDLHLVGDVSAGDHYVIVDDICDGGATFLGLANQLRSAGAQHLTLAITHGLFTKGVDELFGAYDDIFCGAGTDQALPKHVRGIPFRTIYEKGTIR